MAKHILNGAVIDANAPLPVQIYGPDGEPLAIVVTIDPGDIEIGAVELKDGTTDTRAKVGAGNGLLTTDPAVAVADANALAKLELIRALLAGTLTATVSDGSGPLSVDGTVAVSSSALPSGASTSANQDTLLTSVNLTVPGDHAAAISPSDGADLANNTRAIYVGVGGDIVLDLVTTGSTITFKNAQSGSIIPVQAKRVRSTNTTATNLVALW